MADSGEMEEVLGSAVRSGDPFPESKGQGIVSPSGDVNLPEVRRSERTKSLRPISTRGRPVKSRPKSPLLRMAEMRRGGLRGRALRHSGMKGVEGSDLKMLKGKKRLGGRSLQVLASIEEGIEVIDGVVEVAGGGEGMAGDGISGEDGVEMVEDMSAEVQKALPILGSQSRRPEEGSIIQTELIPAGSSADLAMDLISTQPLQNMAFIGEQVIPGCSGKDCLMLEPIQVEEIGSVMKANDLGRRRGSDEEFPALNMDNLRAAREKERNRGGGGKEVPRVVEQAAKEKLDKNKDGMNFKASS